MFCIECGQQLPENAKFCNRCGVKVSNIPNSEDIIDEVERKAEGVYINDNPIGDIAEFFATSPNANEIRISDQLGITGQNIVHRGRYLILLKDILGLYSFYNPFEKKYSDSYEDAKVSNYEGLACVKINGYWGAIDRNLKMVVPAIYECVWTFFEGHAVVKKADKYGVVNTNGEVVIPIKYDRIELKNNGIVMASYNDMYGVTNVLGKTLIPFRKYKSRVATYEGLSCVRYDNKDGYISDEGYEIPCIYKKAANSFSNGFAVVTAENGELRTIDRYGNYADGTKTKPYYGDWDFVGDFNDGVAYIWKNGKYGVIDSNANLVVDFIYDKVSSFEKGYAIVRKEDSVGIINAKGEIVVDIKYKNVGWNGDESLCGALTQVLWDANAPGKIRVHSWRDKWGIIDFNGNFVVNLIYDYIKNFNEGYACVELDGKYGYINIDGHLVIDTAFNYAGNFHNGGAPAIKAKFFSVEVGFIDYGGRYIVSWNRNKGPYPERWLGNTGIVSDWHSDKMGLVDRFGTIIVPLQYDHIEECRDVLIVKKQEQMGVLDTFGNEIIPISAGYDRIFMSDGMWSLRKNGMWTFFDDKFNTITPHNYEDQPYCNRFNYGFARVCINGRSVMLDKNGVEFESIKGYDAGVFAGSRKPAVNFK